MKRYLILSLFTLSLFLFPNSYFQIPNSIFAQTENSWPMAAHDSQRTNATPEQVTGNYSTNTIKNLWYRPIEAYIPQHVQIIAANGTLFIATSRGLYALDAAAGAVKWTYDTEMPLGNSPTIYNGVAYVGGMDRRLHAVNIADGKLKWVFDQTKLPAGSPMLAGFYSNPIVLPINGKTTILTGNRNGTFYAITDNGSSSAFLWSYQTNGSITQSPAYKDNIVYFAANDMYGYALNATTGFLIWKSAKLPGASFHAYWPVILNVSGQDKIVFTTELPYRVGPKPSINSALVGTTSYDNYGYMELADLTQNYGLNGNLPTANLPGDPWAAGKTIVNATSYVNYLNDKPARRTMFALNASDGAITTIPVVWKGTRSGTIEPPIVGPDGTLYMDNIWTSNMVRTQAMGWKWGTPYFSLHGVEGQSDEPQTISFSGNAIYRVICCDRLVDWQSLTGSKGVIWPYVSSIPGISGYDSMWYNQGGGYERLGAYYGGSSDYVYNRSGILNNHGVQNPIVAYQGKIFIHRSNAVLAYGPASTTSYGKQADLRIKPVTDPAIPTIRPPSPDELKAQLTTEIQKMIEAGDLRIGYYNNGQAALDEMHNYFENPGDTLYTLTMAYPYVSASVQPQLLNYIKQEFRDYFNPTMYSSRGWDNTVGTSGRTRSGREAFNLPSELQMDANKMPKKYPYMDPTSYHGSAYYAEDRWNPYHFVYPQFNFYAMWKYAQLVPSDAVTTYNLAKSKLDRPSSAGTVSVGDQELKDFPYRLNSYIAGFIGFLKLQELAGMTGTDATLRTQVTNGLNHLQSLRASALNTYGAVNRCANYFPDTGYTSHCRDFTVGQQFYYLVPELGDYLNQNALTGGSCARGSTQCTGVQNAVSELTYVAQYWMTAGFESVQQEGVMENLYDVDVLLAKAYILKQPYEEVAKHIDTSAFAVGDLLYMNNIIAALNVAPTGSVSPTSIPGDVNGDGSVNLSDLRTILTNYGQTGMGDLNTDGKVNILDTALIIKILIP